LASAGCTLALLAAAGYASYGTAQTRRILRARARI